MQNWKIDHFFQNLWSICLLDQLCQWYVKCLANVHCGPKMHWDWELPLDLKKMLFWLGECLFSLCQVKTHWSWGRTSYCMHCMWRIDSWLKVCKTYFGSTKISWSIKCKLSSVCVDHSVQSCSFTFLHVSHY